MFRRRGFVRPFGRPSIPDIPPALRRANELMAIGDYPGAAQAFEELARGAVARNGPRASLLLLQAGRMRILAGQVPLGMTHLQQGLGLFAARSVAAVPQLWPADSGGTVPARPDRAGQTNRGNSESQPACRLRSRSRAGKN